MNRVVTILLSVLIVLVLATGLLVVRADQRARDDAEKQSCIERAEAGAMIAVLIPAVITTADKESRDAQIRGLGAYSNALDAC